MQRLFTLSFLVFLTAFCPISVWAAEENLADRVVIVVNERDPESVEIGQYYAERRGIPLENVISIDAPVTETISRQEYLEQVRNPLEQALFEGGWIEGMFSRLQDEKGRYRSLIAGHRIAYLVLCRGVPLRIAHDATRVTPEMERNLKKEFRTNAASVDSELALMLLRLPVIGFTQNPLFQNASPDEARLNAIIKVARLDGPTVADAKALVDSALEAERLGLRGRAYVDLTGPHADGTVWLEATAKQIESLGFAVDRHEPKGTFPATARFDAPALYFGWYANDINGPFLGSGFRFPPGAIAFHIHSFSARTLRSATEGWVGPLVARGAAVSLGNVYEPYLALSHRPDLFFDWIRKGGTVGDAAAYAIPAFSWQGVLVGDPLYRPFAVSLEEQLVRAAEEGRDGLSGYAVMRQMNLLRKAGDAGRAIELGLTALDRQTNPALVLKTARLQLEADDRQAAVETLGWIEGVDSGSAMEAEVVKEAVDLLSELAQPESARTAPGAGTSGNL